MNSPCKYLLALSLIVPAYAVTLPEMVKGTLDNNPAMKKNISDYNAVKHDLEIAKSGNRPDIDFNAAMGREKVMQTIPDYRSKMWRKESELMLSHNLFNGYGTTNDIKEQKARITAARSYVLQDANEIALRAVETYIEVLRQKALLDLLDDNVKSHERIYEMIYRKTESGLGKRSDHEQTEGRLALAYANYITQQNNYQDSLINFQRVYGKLASGSDLQTPDSPALPSLDLEQLQELALAYSPTLQTASANINALSAKTEKEKGRFYPSIDGEASGQWNDNIGGDPGHDYGFKLMLRLKYNISDGGSMEALKLQNLQYVTSQKEIFNEQQRAVLEKLKLAHMSNQIIIRQLRCLKLHERSTAKTSDSYSEEYQLGRRELLDLLNVEVEHNTAQQEVTKAEHDLLYAKYRILESIGLLPYALNTGIEERVEAPLPEKVALSVQEKAALTLAGETESFIDIDNICLGFKPVVIAEPVIDEPYILLDETTANEPIIMDNIYFNFNSSVLTDEGEAAVEGYAWQLLKLENYELEISGHADSTGPEKYNQWLSEKRAESVKAALVGHGIDKKLIKTFGMGELAPVADNTLEEGRQKNRRIEFLLKM